MAQTSELLHCIHLKLLAVIFSLYNIIYNTLIHVSILSLTDVGPPNPVLDLRATQIGNTSITVTWTRPEICRTDFYYIVEYSDPDNFGNFLPATGDLMNKRYYNSAPTVTYRVPTISSGLSLRPYTDYTIRVTVHNGVSDQDSENEPLRRAELQNRTREGSENGYKFYYYIDRITIDCI